jgi:hypothetical protein
MLDRTNSTKLGLLVEHLERAAAGEEAVAEPRRGARSAIHAHRNDQLMTCMRIGTTENVRALGGVLDDVQHVAKVDDVGSPERRARTEGRIHPSARIRRPRK